MYHIYLPYLQLRVRSRKIDCTACSPDTFKSVISLMQSAKSNCSSTKENGDSLAFSRGTGASAVILILSHTCATLEGKNYFGVHSSLSEWNPINWKDRITFHRHVTISPDKLLDSWLSLEDAVKPKISPYMFLCRHMQRLRYVIGHVFLYPASFAFWKVTLLLQHHDVW